MVFSERNLLEPGTDEFLTRQQLAVVQRAPQGSHTGAVVRNVPLLQCIRNLTVGLDPAQRENMHLLGM